MSDKLNDKEALKLWKKLDDLLEKSTTDDELVGEPDYKTHPDDLVPALLSDHPDLEDTNALGAWNAQKIYRYFETEEEKRNRRIERYKKIDSALHHPEINGAVNIYADETTAEDQDGKVIHVISENEKVKEKLEDMFARVGIEDKLWTMARNMCAYGDEYWEVIVNKSKDKILSLYKIPRELIERVEKNGVLQGFKSYPHRDKMQDKFYYYRVRRPDYIAGRSQSASIPGEENIPEDMLIYPFRVLHFRVESTRYGIYGESILTSVLSVIEELSLMERALVIARVTRSPERRIYNIDVGQLHGEKALRYAREAVEALRKRKVLDLGTNKVNTNKDFFGASEDIVIPKRTGTEGNSIDTLPQLNQPAPDDLEYIRDRLFPGLGIPRSYLYDDQFAHANLNLSSKDVKFANKIRRMQRFILTQLYKLCRLELKLQGMKDKELDNFEILMNNPSTIHEKEQLEIELQKWTLVGNIKGLSAEQVFYPDYLIYKNYLKLSDEEIVELLKIAQLQQNQGNIFDAMPEDNRPEGAEDLASATPPPAEGAEGGGIPGEAAAALGEPPPAEGGGEGAEPPAEGGGEEAAVPELASADDYDDRRQAIMENLNPKERAMFLKQELLATSRGPVAEEDKYFVSAPNKGVYLENSGDFFGFDDWKNNPIKEKQIRKYASDRKTNTVVTYTEELHNKYLNLENNNGKKGKKSD